MTTAIDAILEHLTSVTFEDLPDSSLIAAKAFLKDTFAVALSGSRVPTVAAVKGAVQGWGQGKQAQVWATGEWLPAGNAALMNGFQIHNQEWDAVHEKAVVHPMATIVSALVAYAQQHQLSGKQLLLGLILAVDVATLIGSCVTSGLRFFRPACCGALGVAAGISAMLGLSREQTHQALGIAYSQLSGTMQAHVEGSPMLAMQIGINARAAMHAVDLARAGFTGPKDILEGPFGYFKLYEQSYQLSELFARLGQQHQIEQVSHKPYPTGRAGHGAVDAILTLQQQHGFTAETVEHIHITAPPLILRLVDRPVRPDMDSSYAKLCQGYIAACALLHGQVSVTDFDEPALRDPRRLALASRVAMSLSDCTDPNALAPIDVQLRLKDGTELRLFLPAVLGHPERPLSVSQQQQKCLAAIASCAVPYSETDWQQLINAIDHLEQLANSSDLVALLISPTHR
ncbi:MmgE/PrpD family protein [Alkalimonas sp.]|uniref:MmgE/PrpD family protein n=1 Tax=Alkalimonas sp. TaxID=1872453 RepID=UPI00263AE4AA|nr:MmgE/PrpD family protein [Alkalimonas sp.]MCC5825075.1 MmgE/PrpD family protein [Alkalimonas sp.]